MELTIELEKSLPEATSIEIGQAGGKAIAYAGVATQVAHQIIYGNVTSVSASDEARVTISIQPGSVSELVHCLSEKGIKEEDAREFGKIVASEGPGSVNEPFGKKTTEWFVDNIKRLQPAPGRLGCR